MAESSHRCGFVAIVGRPNVGKSTLLNHLLGQKLSITSRKPQTTRHRLLGIKTTHDAQILYVDTPGLHLGGRRAINRIMNRAAATAIHDVDVVVFMVEAMTWIPEDSYVLDRLRDVPVPVILVVNKVDRVSGKPELLPYLADAAQRMEFAEVVPVSAKKGDNLQTLEGQVIRRLPEAASLFPEDQLTDRSERFMAAEIIREKLMRRLGQEIPYRLSVEIERFIEQGGLVTIDAVIWVERPGQKAIVIGKGGRILKSVGAEARQDLERLLDKKVYLQTWVKVKEGWSDDERALRKMGYD